MSNLQSRMSIEVYSETELHLRSQQKNEIRSTFLSSLTRMLLNGGCMQSKYKSMISDARLLACAFVMVQKRRLPEEAVFGAT